MANVICPAAKSAAFRAVMAEHPELEAAADLSNPMGRVGMDSEVAEVIGFLASPRASYINGEAINVNGGDTDGGLSVRPGRVRKSSVEQMT